MSSTLKDVAKKVGVHPSTVSRVLSGKADQYSITKKTQDIIFQAARELNYTPNEMARSLRLKKSNTIGLVIPDISNAFFAGIARSIEIESYNLGYRLVVCNTDEDQDKEINLVETLLRRKIDGLILAPVQDCDKHIRELENDQFPLVLVDRYFEDIKTNAVVTDNEGDAYKATEHFIQLGHHRIAFVCGRRAIYTTKGRLIGYKQALEHHNIPIMDELITGNGFTFEAGLGAMKQLLKLPQKPTAVLVGGNVITVGVLEAIHNENLSIPKDISVIGFNDMMLTAYLCSPLTTITHPLEEIGKQAVALLYKAMISPNDSPGKKIVLPTKFMVRSSVASPMS